MSKLPRLNINKQLYDYDDVRLLESLVPCKERTSWCMLFIVGVEDIFWHFFVRLWTLDQPSVWRVGLTLNIFTCDEIGCDPFKQKWTQMHYLKRRWTLQSSKLTAHWTPILHCAQNHNWTTSGPNILARSIFKVGFRWSSLTQNMKESQLFWGKISTWHVREPRGATLLPKEIGIDVMNPT